MIMGFINTGNPEVWKNNIMQIVLTFCKTMYCEPCDSLNKYWLNKELIPVIQSYVDAAKQEGYAQGYAEGQRPQPAPG
jgi:hypothetical protein